MRFMRFSENFAALIGSTPQEVVAKALDVDQATVSRWLDKATPHRRSLRKIALYFSVDEKQLLEGFIAPKETIRPQMMVANDAPKTNLSPVEIRRELNTLRKIIDQLHAKIDDLESKI